MLALLRQMSQDRRLRQEDVPELLALLPLPLPQVSDQRLACCSCCLLAAGLGLSACQGQELGAMIAKHSCC